jgi:hypothetical protein
MIEHQIHGLVEIVVERHETRVVTRQQWIVNESIEVLRIGHFVIMQIAVAALDELIGAIVEPRVVVHRQQCVGAPLHDDCRLAVKVSTAQHFLDAALHSARHGARLTAQIQTGREVFSREKRAQTRCTIEVQVRFIC